jgi:ribonuclease HII
MSKNYERLCDFDSKYKGIIAGVDEVGVGPWAGPVVAAAVILDKNKLFTLVDVDDSKKIPEKKREKLFDIIIPACISYAIEEVNNTIIDEINILQASLLAMRKAIGKLNPAPDIILVDGRNDPGIKKSNIKTIEDGDAKSMSIAAASVIAKVYRDKIMMEQDKIYPQYGFSRHKGYGTSAHMVALHKYGVCEIHRKSYKPVKRLLKVDG